MWGLGLRGFQDRIRVLELRFSGVWFGMPGSRSYRHMLRFKPHGIWGPNRHGVPKLMLVRDGKNFKLTPNPKP